MSRLPSASSSFFLQRIRLPAISSLIVSASRPPSPFRYSSSQPQLSFSPRLRHSPVSPPTSSSFLTWAAPPVVGTPRLRTKVCYCAGSSGRENKELLVQHLLVGEDNLKLLLELQQRISGGVDLSDLAVEYSVCPSKENGGMLGWIRRGQTVPEFEEAAFSAPLNKITRCKTKYGWHLLQVLSEREESVLQDVEPEELHLKMQDPSFIEEVQLIDVREPEEVAQASLPGFKVLPLHQFGTWGSLITDEFDPEKDTYVLCHHGVRSLQIAKWLQTQGFKRVFNISGGIHAYAIKADPSVPTY
ncbi:rhodanese-like/PpiC domain-containing protein 12, chloroplastic [Musa acuminata AAA Group]|uniref:rhodanese-like/PpiC domain-containing protein 12, chloroplastic n=1 Tax=Musa acuminata AAA Group TaxID=214697 RepID=UPI0031D5B706